MRDDVKNQMIDFIGYLSNSGKISESERKRLRESLESPEKAKKEIPATPFLTRHEVAKYLKISTRTVDRMCKNGSLRFYKLGPRYVRFKLQDILTVMQQGIP
jgi:excisionase family DNA binding protein